jgi:hypothetical protein
MGSPREREERLNNDESQYNHGEMGVCFFRLPKNLIAIFVVLSHDTSPLKGFAGEKIKMKFSPGRQASFLPNFRVE